MGAGAIAMQTAGSASSTATAALLSAPRIPSLAFSQNPSRRTGSTGASSGTVSMCAHSRMHCRSPAEPPGEGGAPIRASRLPQSEPATAAASSSCTSIPSAPSSRSISSRAGALVAGGTLGTAELGEDVVQVTALQLVSARRSAHRFSATIRESGSGSSGGLTGRPTCPRRPRPRAGARRRRTRGTAARGARGGT